MISKNNSDVSVANRRFGQNVNFSKKAGWKFETNSDVLRWSLVKF